MEDTVFMITQLDSEEGFAEGRRIFLLKSNENYCRMITKLIVDKNVKGMLTTSKVVNYA